MTDEVRDMISKALYDEPPIGLTYETVLGDGRKRRTRRNLGIVGGAVLGVVAVASAAVVVSQFTGRPANDLTSGSTTEPASAGCTVPAKQGGFSHLPDGAASAEELAESARLTAAFAKFDVPLPAGVTMEPVRPQLCVIDKSWGARFTLRSGNAERVVFLEVMPRGGQPPGDCTRPGGQVKCHVTVQPDGTVIRFDYSAPQLPHLPIMTEAWRPDDTIVRVLETDSDASKAAGQILGEKELLAIVMAPELKVSWSVRVRTLPGEPTARRAAELTNLLTQKIKLAQGMKARKVSDASDALSFYVSQGGYKLNADLEDAAGIGSLFINLNPPGGDTEAILDCQGQPGCELTKLTNGRKATVTRQQDGKVIRLIVNTVADDGTQVMVMSSNQSNTAQITSTRPEPSLSIDDLRRIAALPGLVW